MVGGKRKYDPAVDGRLPPKKWMKIEPIRLMGQFFLILLLNFTVVGSVYVSPFLPVLRLDGPVATSLRGPINHFWHRREHTPKSFRAWPRVPPRVPRDPAVY